MANEIRVTSKIIVNKTGSSPLRYDGVGPSGFSATMTGAKGPTPGAVSVSVYGTDIDLSQLTNPSVCDLVNQGTQFTIEVGVFDPERGRFFPMIELRPGEKWPVRLASNLGGEYGAAAGSGTADKGAGTNRLRARTIGAVGSVGYLYVGAFDE